MSKILGYWEQLKDIANALGGELKIVYTKNSYGKETKQIIIEYETENSK
tara:strand:+ start:318 stop:464 length:147 start_codon:yes stop_codon:yes gene_type:complete